MISFFLPVLASLMISRVKGSRCRAGCSRCPRVGDAVDEDDDRLLRAFGQGHPASGRVGALGTFCLEPVEVSSFSMS